MMHPAKQYSPATWFEEVARSYIENHQGCPWCGACHCVFRSRRPEREQFSCSECDFFACHIHQDDSYFVTPGQSVLVAAAGTSS
jgi:hypothetical protein